VAALINVHPGGMPVEPATPNFDAPHSNPELLAQSNISREVIETKSSSEIINMLLGQESTSVLNLATAGTPSVDEFGSNIDGNCGWYTEPQVTFCYAQIGGVTISVTSAVYDDVQFYGLQVINGSNTDGIRRNRNQTDLKKRAQYGQLQSLFNTIQAL